MSSDQEIAIRVNGLSKCYHIYGKPQDRLKHLVMGRLNRFRSGVGKAYHREFWALKNISFEVKRGETVGIIGRNGSGKSTLLQIICGTLAPTSGSVETSGRVAALLELGAGFNPEFTGRENVYMYAAILGLSRQETEARFDDIVAFAEIGDFVEQPVKTYSSGMYVRLAFAVIAHVDADILIIDEALSVGDAFFVQKCMRFLREFMERGTVFFVSHDTSAVLSLCKRAIWLSHGEIASIGAPKEVAARYLEAIYASRQGSVSAVSSAQSYVAREPSVPPRDMRQDMVNGSTLRNDLEVFRFNPDAKGFGAGGATIVAVRLEDQNAAPLLWAVGGENVVLVVDCKANQDLFSPIVGFYVKDKRGQVLFGDNTYLTYLDQPQSIRQGESVETRFEFRMPILPAGDYTVGVAIADGTQAEHVQHCWLHEALVLKSHSSSVSSGLVGIPMSRISMQTL